MSRTLETILIVNETESSDNLVRKINKWNPEESGNFTLVTLPEPTSYMFFSNIIVGSVKRLDLRDLVNFLKTIDWTKEGASSVQLLYRGEDMDLFHSYTILEDSVNDEFDSKENDEFKILKMMDKN